MLINNGGLSYQSRVGPLKWIGPSTDHVIAEHGRSSSETPLVIVPITFVSEHSETLVELDIEYKHLAQESGVKHYYRVPTVSTDPLFIDCLAAEVKKVLSAQNDCFCAKFKGTEKGCHKSQKCFSLSS